jgi:hypothetical protein
MSKAKYTNCQSVTHFVMPGNGWLGVVGAGVATGAGR